MNPNIIYTDYCSNTVINKIKQELGISVVKMLTNEQWNTKDAMRFITMPEISLAVINTINEKTVTEMGLLNFMCKPILVTTNEIEKYSLLENKIIDYYDKTCSILQNADNFIVWYRRMFW